MALLAGEKPHDPLTATRTGSYYDLIIPYVLGSGVFDPGDEREGWVIDYLRHHGGLAMGMLRSTPHQGEFDDQPGVNPLYGLRYNLTLLRRGDRGHALSGFYGQLAQGMTRDTFVGGEGSRFLHGDAHGRSFYLPPNTASNATPKGSKIRAAGGGVQIIRQPTTYDVCIVGSGAGGGMAAHVLCQAGANVVMLEAGPMWDAAKDSKMSTWAYESPRRGETFVSRKISRAAARINHAPANSSSTAPARSTFAP